METFIEAKDTAAGSEDAFCVSVYKRRRRRQRIGLRTR